MLNMLNKGCLVRAPTFASRSLRCAHLQSIASRQLLLPSAGVRFSNFASSISYQHGRRQRQEFQFLKEKTFKIEKISPDRLKFNKSRQLEDFNNDAMSLDPLIQAQVLSGNFGKLTVSEDMMKVKHPLEYMAEDLRAREDPYKRLNNTSLMLTNFPKGVTVTKKYISKLCTDGHKNAIINDIKLQEAYRGDGSKGLQTQNQIAYAIVEFESEAWMKKVRRALMQQWILDKKLKVKTLDDQNMETFRERTVVLTGVPSHIRPAELASEVAKYGAITSIELPTYDKVVQEQIDSKAAVNDSYERARLTKKDQKYRLAKLLEKQAAESEIQTLLNQTRGEEVANELIKSTKTEDSKLNNFEILDSEKFASFYKLMVQLQHEGIKIETSKSTINSLAKEVESRMKVLESAAASDADMASIQNDSSEQVIKTMESKRQEITQALQYLMTNRESLSESQAAFIDKFNTQSDRNRADQAIDPTYKLFRMSMAELTNAYDVLLSILNKRQKLIQSRIKSVLEDHGVDQRVLHQSHDYRREQEQMPDLLGEIYRRGTIAIDEYLSVNEQIQNMQSIENIGPEQKLYMLFSETYPDFEQINFSQSQLMHARAENMQYQRVQVFPREEFTLSQLRARGITPMPFISSIEQEIQNKVKQIRDDYQTPFDELYHKERKLVLDIVRIEATLKQIRDSLPNPAFNRLYDVNNIKDDSGYGNLYQETNETPFDKDQKRENELNKQSDILKVDEAADFYQESQEKLSQESEAHNEMYQLAKDQIQANRQVNLGYALVTFSHTDEARQMVIANAGTDMVLENNLVQVMAKGPLDHSELDEKYFMRKMKNDAKLADHIVELREAKKQLRDYENTIDQEMPKFNRYDEFKNIVQEMIEKPKYKTRRNTSLRRTKRETEDLHNKMRQLQQENPNLDITQLFESDRLQTVRREQHKQAFQQFKKYEFLKAGLFDDNHKKDLKLQLKEGQARPNEIFEQFNYPHLKDTVAAVLSDGVQATINVRGEINRRPGRKFNYSEQDFLQDYLGRDYTAKINLHENEMNQIFGFQKTLKELFPNKEKYMKLPKYLVQAERLKKWAGDKQVEGDMEDLKLQQFIQGSDHEEIQKRFNQVDDLDHPEEEGRTYFKDLEKEFGAFMDEMNKQGKRKYHIREYDKIKRKIDNEYNEGFIPERDRLEEQLDEIDHKYDIRDNQLFDQIQNQLKEQQEAIRSNFKDQVLQQTGQNIDDYQTQIHQQQKQSTGLAHDAEELDHDFEDHSMFNPGPTRAFSHKNQDEQPQQHDEQTITKSMNQVKDQQRVSNENVYNLKYSTRKIFGEVQVGPQYKFFQKMADYLTKKRREEFVKVQSEQFNQPDELRVPHYYDKYGNLKAYSQQEIEAHRQKMKVPIPDEYDSQMENNEGSSEPMDLKIHPDIQQEILGALRDTIDSEDHHKSLTIGHEINQIQGQVRPLENVLKMDVNEVVKETTIADVLDILRRQDFPVLETFDDLSGGMHMYQKTFMDETDLAKFKFRDQDASMTSLSEFMDENISKDSDIYKAYIDAIEQTVTEDKTRNTEFNQFQEKNQMLENVKNFIPKSPQDIQNYFEREASGKSLIDDLSGIDYERAVEDEQISNINNELQDHENYRKELISRLVGGTLSSRQYAVLMNIPSSELELEQLQKKNNEKLRFDSREQIRNVEEIIEMHRRRLVLNGTWPEDESHLLMQQLLERVQSIYPTQRSYDRFMDDKKKHNTEMIQARNSSQILEREYYFDETLGQSLAEHTNELASQYPNVSIETRRDNDGFPIVKLSMKRQYKYNIDQIFDSDVNWLKQTEQETVEALLAVFMPQDPKEFVDQAASGQAFQGVNNQLLMELIFKHYEGEYKDDLNGFIEQCQLLKEQSARQDQSAKKQDGYPLEVLGFKSFLEQLEIDFGKQEIVLRDQVRFDKEIQEQMALRAREKLFFTERTEQDFVKPARSENLMYRDQVNSLKDTIHILEKDTEWLLNQQNASKPTHQPMNDNSFNQEKFDELKKQIRLKKEAKERVLAQGFPEFKPYLRM